MINVSLLESSQNDLLSILSCVSLPNSLNVLWTQHSTLATTKKMSQYITDEYMLYLIQQSMPSSVDIPGASYILFRHARQRDYFALKPDQVIYSEPHRYNLRLQGIEHTMASRFTFELHIHHKESGSTEYIPYGISFSKQVIVRGAPHDSIDVRVSFAVESRMYNDSKFFIRVMNEKNEVVCQTSEFFLERKKKKS